MMNTTQIKRGFTLIELMTATGLTVVMLLLMAGLYSQTADIIRAGIATSDNIERSRSAANELVSIFNYMIPPSGVDTNTGQFLSLDTNGDTTDGFVPIGTAGRTQYDATTMAGGVLVISNKMWSASEMYAGQDPLNQYPGTNSKRLGFTPEDIRSDMLTFFVYNNRSASADSDVLNLKSLTPSSTTSFASNSTIEPYLGVAKVWIGHLNSVQPSGMPHVDRIYNNALGTSDPVRESFGNRVANEWVLGMQYLLTGYNGPVSLINNWDRHAKSILDDEAAEWADASVAHIPSKITKHTHEGIWQGLSDLSRYSFNNKQFAEDKLDQKLIIGSGHESWSLFKPSTRFNPGAEESDAFTSTNTESSNYKDNALRISYATNRLHFNPAPDANLRSYQIGQTHAGFLPYCGEIVVEFAADADRDGEIDREGYTDLETPSDGVLDNTTADVNWNGIENDGSIIWYSAYQSVNNSGQSFGPAMRPKWNMDPATGYLQIPDKVAEKNNTEYAFVWRHDYPDNWPYLLRIRLRLMSRSGVLEFETKDPQFDFKKRRLLASGEPKINFTNFIDEGFSRYDPDDISYMSAQGKIIDRLPGVWYEYIVPVRRQ